MLQDLTYTYYRKQGSTTVYLVLHGGAPVGIETPFISSIIQALITTGTSVFGFNFPYCERGEEHSSGPELAEETAALEKVVQFLRSEGFTRIVIVAKSMGAVTTSYWLERAQPTDVEVVILGYVLGSVKSHVLQNRLRLVIQGENDRFGNAEAIRQELSAHSVEAQVLEVPHADHSYQNANKEPVYQGQAIDLLLGSLA